MRFPPCSGILLHPASLPGRFGIGDLGPVAFRLADFLWAAGQKLWQVLPLGPTGYGDSPYQCYSSVAGNPLLISPEMLEQDGLLDAANLESAPVGPPDDIDYQAVVRYKLPLLRTAYRNFVARGSGAMRQAFREFWDKNSACLYNYALFMAVKEAHGGVAWTRWDPAIAARDATAIRAWSQRLEPAIAAHRFEQFV